MSTRSYSYKDVDMLTASGIAVENFKTHKAALIPQRTNWADPFIGNLENRINFAFVNYLGIQSVEALKDATKAVLQIMDNVLDKLAFFTVQVRADFKDTPETMEEIFGKLGITDHYDAAQNGDQEAMVELLSKFYNNLDPALLTTITSKGMPATLPNQVKAFFSSLKQANEDQEVLKSGKKDITDTAVTEFNGIYEAVIAFCKIAAKFFEDDELKSEKFVFSVIAARLKSPPRNDDEEPTP